MDGRTRLALVVAAIGLARCVIRRGWHRRLEDVKIIKTTVGQFEVATVATEEACDAALEQLQHGLEEAVIGFDCEWEANGKIAVLQLAGQRLVVIVQLAVIGRVPPSLAMLMRNSAVYKAGAAISGDRKKLRQDWHEDMSSWVCLQYVADALRLVPVKGVSLKALSEAHAGIVLPKTKRVRCSKWESNPLSAEQIEYAALDAVASRLTLLEMLRKARGNPLASYQHLANVAHRSRRKKDFIRSQDEENDTQGQGDPNTIEPNPQPAAPTRRSKKPVSDTISKPVYSNCLILAPDGEPLVCTDEKKAQWYVQSQRAVVVEKVPRLVIRLTFEPVGRNTTAEVIENICVACGAEKELKKHHVVPLSYRKQFPRHRKEHQPHDIVLCCARCAAVCKEPYRALREQLEKEHRAAKPAPHTSCARAAASALLKGAQTSSKPHPADDSAVSHCSTSRIPLARFNELLCTVRDFHPLLPHEPLTHRHVREMLKNTEPVPLSRQVVLSVLASAEGFHGKEEALTEFVKRWRRLFLHTMSPRHLPPSWSVHSVHLDERLLPENVELLYADFESRNSPSSSSGAANY
ncbi:Protein RRP6-like 3 [Diplonema papillatum]|nr:Protein RRP6-like 3 [Diplonema papillatum]